MLIQAIVSLDLEGLPFIGWRDLMALKILPPNFPCPIAMQTARVYEDEEQDVLSTFAEDPGDDEHQQNNDACNDFWGTKKHKGCYRHVSAIGRARQVTQSNARLEAINARFPDVKCLSLGAASGTLEDPKMKIKIDPSKKIIPCHVLTDRKVQLHFLKQADALVEELINAGVIVKVDKPTTWCSLAHFVTKGRRQKCTSCHQLSYPQQGCAQTRPSILLRS